MNELEDISPEDYERAKQATYACYKLVLLNLQLKMSGAPVKLYTDMKDAKDMHHFYDFLHFLHIENMADFTSLMPYIKPKRGKSNK